MKSVVKFLVSIFGTLAPLQLERQVQSKLNFFTEKLTSESCDREYKTEEELSVNLTYFRDLFSFCCFSRLFEECILC